jgi:TolA-binding protein
MFKIEAQNLYSYPVDDEYFKQATDLYSKEMYRVSLEKLSFAMDNSAGSVLVEDDITFYAAMSALYNEQSDANALLTNIINAKPKNIHYPEAMFGYGRYLYDKGKFGEAAATFQAISASDIPRTDVAEYHFKSGYSKYKSGQTEAAISDFRQIKEQRNMYADAALYYYSHIEYENGNYITAKQGFERLKTNPNYSSLIPYYTLQIAFIQKDFDKVIAEGEAFIKNSPDTRSGEIMRIVAEAYLLKGNLQKAGEHFSQYEKITSKLSKADYYLKGFIAYKADNYADAINSFISAGNANDSLSQLADYYLADCYLQTNAKEDALKVFMRASKATFNQTVRADAFLNYAKLSLELQNNDAPMTSYLEQYPEALNNSELAIYRAKAAANKGNYSEALNILRSVSNPSPAEIDAIQQLSYASGIELFKNKEYRQAIEMFDVSVKSSGYRNSISALSGYWKANATYMLGNFGSALTLFQNFINTAGSFKLLEYNIAHYNIGYCYFKEQKYDQALQWFRKYISFEAGTSRRTMYLGDCYNRIGDCYFKKRDYQLAAENYTTSESLGLSNPDYSALQRGISLGFISGEEAKINALKHIPRSYPNSKFIPVAYYELGRTYQQQMKYDDAISSFQSVISKYASSPVYPKALVEMGLIELNRGNTDRALLYYQQVVNKSPNSPEAQDAMDGLKNIYLDQNRMDEYIAYSNKVGKAINSPGEKDSLIFIAAERLYQSGDCARALPALKKYLEEYPLGMFLIAANFYTADCSMKQNEYAEALKGYSFVVRQPNNDFTEAAWSGVARANYNMKNYADAAAAFEQVKALAQTTAGKFDAELGCMRSYIALENNEKAAEAAKVVAAAVGIPDELKREANIIIGRAYQQSGEYQKAIEIFEPLAKNLNQAIDAEAKYRIIASYFALKKDKIAAEEVYSFADSKSTQQYWVAKSFIILGDIFVQQKNLEQARETYKSVAEGYPRQDDGVVEEAQSKLANMNN